MAWQFQPLLPSAALQSAGGGHMFDAALAGFTLNGQAIGFSRDYAISAAPGIYALNGGTVTFDASGADGTQTIGSLTLGLTLGL